MIEILKLKKKNNKKKKRNIFAINFLCGSFSKKKFKKYCKELPFKEAVVY